jgi:hypothetical protein
MARKTEVYTWRVSRALKVGLEEVARAQRRTVAQLLDEIVAEHLQAAGRGSRGEAERQRRLHAQAARFAGRLSGSDPDRASRASELVRARLRRASRAR